MNKDNFKCALKTIFQLSKMHRLSTSAYKMEGKNNNNNDPLNYEGGKRNVKRKIGEGREGGGKLQSARAMRAAKIRHKMQARNCLTVKGERN